MWRYCLLLAVASFGLISADEESGHAYNDIVANFYTTDPFFARANKLEAPTGIETEDVKPVPSPKQKAPAASARSNSNAFEKESNEVESAAPKHKGVVFAGEPGAPPRTTYADLMGDFFAAAAAEAVKPAKQLTPATKEEDDTYQKRPVRFSPRPAYDYVPPSVSDEDGDARKKFESFKSGFPKKASASDASKFQGKKGEFQDFAAEGMDEVDIPKIGAVAKAMDQQREQMERELDADQPVSSHKRDRTAAPVPEPKKQRPDSFLKSIDDADIVAQLRAIPEEIESPPERDRSRDFYMPPVQREESSFQPRGRSLAEPRLEFHLNPFDEADMSSPADLRSMPDVPHRPKDFSLQPFGDTEFARSLPQSHEEKAYPKRPSASDFPVRSFEDFSVPQSRNLPSSEEARRPQQQQSDFNMRPFDDVEFGPQSRGLPQEEEEEYAAPVKRGVELQRFRALEEQQSPSFRTFEDSPSFRTAEEDSPMDSSIPYLPPPPGMIEATGGAQFPADVPKLGSKVPYEPPELLYDSLHGQGGQGSLGGNDNQLSERLSALSRHGFSDNDNNGNSNRQPESSYERESEPRPSSRTEPVSSFGPSFVPPSFARPQQVDEDDAEERHVALPDPDDFFRGLDRSTMDKPGFDSSPVAVPDRISQQFKSIQTSDGPGSSSSQARDEPEPELSGLGGYDFMKSLKERQAAAFEGPSESNAPFENPFARQQQSESDYEERRGPAAVSVVAAAVAPTTPSKRATPSPVYVVKKSNAAPVDLSRRSSAVLPQPAQTGDDTYYKFDPKDFGQRLGEAAASLTSEAAKAGFQSDWRTAEEAAMERRSSPLDASRILKARSASDDEEAHLEHRSFPSGAGLAVEAPLEPAFGMRVGHVAPAGAESHQFEHVSGPEEFRGGHSRGNAAHSVHSEHERAGRSFRQEVRE